MGGFQVYRPFPPATTSPTGNPQSPSSLDIQAEIAQTVTQTAPTGEQKSRVVEIGGSSGVTGQVTVTTTPTPVRLRNECRRAIKITNLGLTDVWIGFSASVNPLSGDLLVGSKGASIIIDSTLDIFAVVAAGTQLVSFMEISE